MRRSARTALVVRSVTVALLLLSAGLAYTGPCEFFIRLYYYDITATDDRATASLALVPPGSTVYCVDETFYEQYLLVQAGVGVVDEAGRSLATRLLRRPDEIALFLGATLLGTGADTELYRLR